MIMILLNYKLLFYETPYIIVQKDFFFLITYFKLTAMEMRNPVGGALHHLQHSHILLIPCMTSLVVPNSSIARMLKVSSNK